VTRAPHGQPHCNGVWPITGNPCKNKLYRDGNTCPAHTPDGDRRKPAPPDEVRCAAVNRETGERCRMRAVPGATVCTHHGGGAPQVRAKGRERRALQEARAMVDTYGLPVETTPEQAILDEVHRTAGHVAWLLLKIRDLNADDLIWGVTKVKEGGDDRGTTREAAVHVWLKLYRDERAHLAKVSADAIRVGIEARQVKLAEEQGSLVARTIRAILDDLHLTAAQRALIPQVVPEHLRALHALAATN
jgi:hypothetical protein